MTVLIISSTEDPAGTNIKKGLLKKDTWEKVNTFCNNPVYQNKSIKELIMITINDRTIRHENIDKEAEEELGIKPKQAIFISRHKSKTGEPTLTTHPIGNYADAQFGGKPKTLIESSPRLSTELLRLIKKNAEKAKTYHKVCFEVTHHGPYLNIPTLYAEVGSSQEEWEKTEPADIVAESLLDLFNKHLYEEEFPDDIPVLLGIGGGHYAPRFTDVALEKKAAFGHMIPSYHIDAGNINNEILEKTIKAIPNLYGVYLHKKALKKSKVAEFKNYFQEKNIPVVSSKQLDNLS